MSGITDKYRVNGVRISCEHCVFWRKRFPWGCFCSITGDIQDYWDRCERFKPTEKALRKAEREGRT